MHGEPAVAGSHPGWVLVNENVDDPAISSRAVHQVLPGNLPGRA